jgi:hypothetical protein
VFGDTEVTFTLVPMDGGTRLRVEHGGWDEAGRAHRDGFDEGWHSKFDEGWHSKLATELPALLGAGLTKGTS